ncbi:vomeronasal type-2 receptor 26-like [Rhinophrynus dorsalis]
MEQWIQSSVTGSSFHSSIAQSPMNVHSMELSYRSYSTLVGPGSVGIVTSDNDSDQRGSHELKDMIIKSGGCVAYLETLSSDLNIEQFLWKRILETSGVNVVIIYCSSEYFDDLLLMTSDMDPKVVFIMSCTWSYPTDYEDSVVLLALNGSLLVSIRKGNILGFKDFLYNVNPQKYPDDRRLENTDSCKGNETLQNVPLNQYNVYNFRLTYSIYTAVYALAHALHTMLSDTSGQIHDKDTSYQPWKLKHHLKNIHYSTSSDEISFDEFGSLPAYYDIENFFVLNNLSTAQETIGSFKVTESQQFHINESAISWNPVFTQVPFSTCSDICELGYRKAPRIGKPSCCYDCVPCSEGEISNTTDMENCIPCPEDQWSNEGRYKCVPRSKDFLSYEDTLGAALASSALVLTVITSAVLGIFILHRDTPVVRANNRNLSYLLLLSLMMSFLCSLLFIGRPGKVICQLRQAAFGIIFTVAVSCILAKTITVVIAFRATKPGSKLKKWMGSRTSIILVLVCTLGQIVICVVWLICSPPFPDYDTHSVTGKMILQCNEGSVIAFYIVVGYMGLLAALSFLVAFLVRKVPDRYNEAQLITFSMLLFCSVWVSFIPAYLSTKGKYTVAVEIFTILASSAGLLGCIFIPKCYIILIRPEINCKGNITKKKQISLERKIILT